MVRFAVAALLIFGIPREAPAQSCPTEAPHTREVVERFLTRSAYAAPRQQTGLAGVEPSNVRLLLSGIDDGVCGQLNAAVGSSTGQSGPWRWSYYTAGGRFIVALQYLDAPGTRRVGFVPLYVFDTSMRLLGTYAM